MSADLEPVVPVIFRADRGGPHKGTVTAVFPTIPGTDDPSTMTCYAHIGQHASCSLDWLNTTRPAKQDEYAALKRELESAPYNYRLWVCRRMSRKMHDERRSELRR